MAVTSNVFAVMGGSRLRPESTGFGAVYFVQNMCKQNGVDYKGKTLAISGFGNVA